MKRNLPAHLEGQFSVPLAEVGMQKGSFVGPMQDSFKVPHVQLSRERTILGLRKEEGQESHQAVSAVHHDGPSIQDPAYYILGIVLFNVLHQVMETPREL